MTKLTELRVDCHIKGGDLSSLSGLTELRSLQINQRTYLGNDYNNRTYIRDLSPLAGLTKLTSLSVGGTAEHIDTSPVAFVADLDIN